MFAAGCICCAVLPAVAEETAYCVTCTGPDQTYVCRVEAGGARPSDALKLYCVIRTAKEGHHASCSAERSSPACNGVEKVYSYDGAMPEDLASDPRIKQLTDKVKQEQQAFDKPNGNGNAPKTLVELGGRAVSASRQGLRSARHALGGGSPEAGQPPGQPPALDEAPPPLSAEASPEASPDAPQPNRVQRAYRCMLSFFRHCSSESAVR